MAFLLNSPNIVFEKSFSILMKSNFLMNNAISIMRGFFFKIKAHPLVLFYMPVYAMKGLLEAYHELEASLCYVAWPCLKENWGKGMFNWA